MQDLVRSTAVPGTGLAQEICAKTMQTIWLPPGSMSCRSYGSGILLPCLVDLDRDGGIDDLLDVFNIVVILSF